MDEETGEVNEKPEESDAKTPDEMDLVYIPTKHGGLSPLRILIVLFIVIGIFLAFTIPGMLGHRRNSWNNRVQATLRSLGQSQLAYRTTNEGGWYGSVSALSNSGLIASESTQDTIIENYSLHWSYYNLTGRGDGSSVFTIIALPQRERIGGQTLRTFAISEDQVVRIYNPENGNVYSSVKTWDPIL